MNSEQIRVKKSRLISIRDSLYQISKLPLFKISIGDLLDSKLPLSNLHVFFGVVYRRARSLPVGVGPSDAGFSVGNELPPSTFYASRTAGGLFFQG